MMKGGGPKNPEPENDLANTNADELASNQEAVVAPWFCGEAKFAVKWVSSIYNLQAKVGPFQRSGGKK